MKPLRECRIGVVGAGAVGSYYGGMLARAGYDVRFWLRSDLAVVREKGLRIRSSGEEWTIAAQACGSGAEMGLCDLVIIGLKATGNAALEKMVPPLLHESTALLTLQNGLGNEDSLAARWGADRVLGGLCFVCLNRCEPGVIEHYDHGTLSLGEFGRPPAERTHAVATAFIKSGIEAKVVENLAAERWRKLVWNIPFNGLAIAAGGATVADVLGDAGLQVLARGLMAEVIAAANALGHAIPESFADFQIDRSWSAGAYKPSSMIDWQLGRPVEVEAIWGEPWRQGTAVGVPMPRLEMLYRLLQRLTRMA